MEQFLKKVPLLFFCAIIPTLAIAVDNTPQIDPVLELIHTLGCKGCHMISGEGGSLAPDLTQIGSRLTAIQIEAQLTTGTASQGKSFMPSYNSLSINELKQMGKYLYNLR